jgi:hypothetical protein
MRRASHKAKLASSGSMAGMPLARLLRIAPQLPRLQSS